MTSHKIQQIDYAKLYAAVAQSASTVLITNVQGIIEFVNPRFTELTGYEPEEILGKDPSILQSGKTPVEVYQEMWTSIKAGKHWRGEILNRHKNGS